MAFYLISSVGLMFILKYGEILNVPRTWITAYHHLLAQLFKCSLCIGFWSGTFVSLWVYNEYGMKALLFPFASSCVCFFADTILLLLQGIDNLTQQKNK